ncbi:MAG: cystathionine beta-lyase, partial [Novosphingobium sp.]|nr:cystathionine beta-lyase [Novosphingobium sp.]
SWGGFESLALPIEPSAYRSCMAWPPKPGETEDRFGVRLSIGLEDPADLIADIEQAMAAWHAA